MAMPPLATGGQLNVGALLQTLNDIVQAVNNLNMTLTTIFPTATATLSTSATAGAASALPGNPEKYVTIIVGGVSHKVAAWLP